VAARRADIRLFVPDSWMAGSTAEPGADERSRATGKGTTLLMLDLAGWRIGLDCQPALHADTIATRYAPFLAPPDRRPDVLATITLEDQAQGGILSDPGWEMRVTRQGSEFLLDASAACGKIVLGSGLAFLKLTHVNFLPGLEYFLRVLAALLAYERGGLMVHSAGLLTGGQALLFIGHSGSGKSTVVALSPHASALSDDYVALRPEPSGWRAYGTPFWNPPTLRRDGQTASGTLVGIYQLVQDQAVYLRSMSLAAASAELVAHCSVINGDATELAGLLARCRQLAEAVPVRQLHFRKDPGFWEVLGSGGFSKR